MGVSTLRSQASQPVGKKNQYASGVSVSLTTQTFHVLFACDVAPHVHFCLLVMVRHASNPCTSLLLLLKTNHQLSRCCPLHVIVG